MDRKTTTLRIRKQEQTKTLSAKVESPIAKYDSAGNLSCIICRVPVKSATVWKVHINSKLHKQAVELAKQGKLTKTTESKDKPREPSKPIANKAANVPIKVTSSSQFTAPSVVTAKLTSAPSAETSQSSAPASATEALPEKFFDQDNTKNSTAIENNKDEEWIRFQREIKEAATVSNIIIAEEQENVNIKRQLKEIDEQIENWNRFIKVNDKKNQLLNKKRKIREVTSESDSSDNESIPDDLTDWRAKSIHK